MNTKSVYRFDAEPVKSQLSSSQVLIVEVKAVCSTDAPPGPSILKSTGQLMRGE